MDIEFEIYLNGHWFLAAHARIHNPSLGYLGPVTLDYDLNYFANHGAEDFADGAPAQDIRALSVRLPVDLASGYTDKLPPFMLDLMPQGHARRKLAEAMGPTW